MYMKFKNFTKNYWIYFIIAFNVLVLPIFLYLIFYTYYYGYKDVVTLELGTTLEEEMFFYHEIPENTQFLTSFEDIDFSKVGEYEIELEINHKKKTSLLKIVDTTPPEVEVQELYKYIDYEINPEDFIVSKTDLSSIDSVQLESVPDISKFGDYSISILVKDAYGNETKKETILHVGVIKSFFELELGTVFKKEDLLYNKEDVIEISQEEIDLVNQKVLGEYVIHVLYEETEYTSKIVVKDTTPPTLELKNVTIYDDVKTLKKEDFIAQASDASGEVTTTLLTEIPFGVLGTHEIEIQAIDQNGLQTTKKAQLAIVKDTTAPVIYGLSTLTINKHSSINFMSGVSARDDKDGPVSVSVNSSKVNVNVAGTYYATYSATDSSGNTKTASRKIIVNHDQEDVNALVRTHASRVGSSIPEINQYVKSTVHYSDSWGDSDPVWYGLTNYRGNCYVHAMVYKALLEAKGYTVKLIWTTDRSHYWNLVYSGGKWCHSDATPGNLQEGIICSNDTERLQMLQGRDWDHSAWPEAN